MTPVTKDPALLVASLLDEHWDDVLERAARDAAAAVDASSAHVTLLSTHLACFAAHVGLPAELEVSRAVAKDVCFCHVVKDAAAPFVVEDAVLSPALRPELVDAFGFRAYVGVPVSVGGVVVGALAALDRRPRSFGGDDVARLSLLAASVSRRLAERAAARAASVAVDVAAVELLPYLRLLQAVQVGALTPEAMTRALRVLPPVPSSSSSSR